MYLNQSIPQIIRNRKKIVDHIYNADIKSLSEQEFIGQIIENTCGEGVKNSFFYNVYDLNFSSESKLTDLEHKISEKEFKKQDKEITKFFDIRENGNSQYHFANLARFFKLKLFTSNEGSIADMIYLLNHNIWPIIFRPYDSEDPTDEGHYLLLHKHYPDSKKFKIFDPNYDGKRPRKIVIHPGRQRIEDYKTFNYNWTFKDKDTYKKMDEKAYMFFCRPFEKPERELKGYYVV